MYRWNRSGRACFIIFAIPRTRFLKEGEYNSPSSWLYLNVFQNISLWWELKKKFFEKRFSYLLELSEMGQGDLNTIGFLSLMFSIHFFSKKVFLVSSLSLQIATWLARPGKKPSDGCGRANSWNAKCGGECIDSLLRVALEELIHLQFEK